MRRTEWIPNAGDLVFLSFDPQSGHEQAGTRPALVLSPASYNSKAGLALVCPITSQVKGYPFEVPIPQGKKITGVILADQLRSMDWKSRRANFVDSAPRDVVDTVRQYISHLIGITK